MTEDVIIKANKLCLQSGKRYLLRDIDWWSYVKKKYKLNVTNFHILRASFNSPFSTHLLPFF